jgi:hypothetical protein
MIIFTSKLPRVWKSSGVKLISGKLELSSFSFLEESFLPESDSFSIDIFSKNILGNGTFFLKVFEENNVILDTKIETGNICLSKKTFLVTCNELLTLKVHIYRDKRSTGKILIDRVAIHFNKKEVKIEKEPEVIVPIKEEEKTEVVEKIEEKTKIKKKKRFAKVIIKKVFIENKKVLVNEEPAIKKDVVIPEVPQIKEEIKEKISASITVLDFNFAKDERDIFKYRNLINFGKKQIFFVKQSINSPQDFSKHSHVRLFEENRSIIDELKDINIKKLSFKENEIDEELLKILTELKREL